MEGGVNDVGEDKSNRKGDWGFLTPKLLHSFYMRFYKEEVKTKKPLSRLVGRVGIEPTTY